MWTHRIYIHLKYLTFEIFLNLWCPLSFSNFLHSHPPCLNGCLLLSSVAQLCPTLCRLVYTQPSSPVDGIYQARILKWVATSFSKGSSWPRNQTLVSCIAGGFFITALPGKPISMNSILFFQLVRLPVLESFLSFLFLSHMYSSWKQILLVLPSKYNTLTTSQFLHWYPPLGPRYLYLTRLAYR